MKTLTFIGNGNMALSIAKGVIGKYNIEVVGRDKKKLEAFKQALNADIDSYLIEGFDISHKTVLLCVKPNNIETVAQQLQGRAKALFSVLAGIEVATLKTVFQTQNVVRAMPNLAASMKASMTTLTGSYALKEEALEIFNTIGRTIWVASDKELDIATALAGSGPAYLALIAEALADGAVAQGLKRDDAVEIMRGLFDGFGKLIQTTHPALLKDGVMSPGGTTAAGYTALEEAGVRQGCIKAIEAAYQKARSL